MDLGSWLPAIGGSRRHTESQMLFLSGDTAKLRIEAPGFYQYKTTSQTPGLYAGPGVYPGPGLYHNMSSLCYFIQKQTINFHVYGYQYFVYFHTKSYYIS